MQTLTEHILSIVIFLPLAAGAIILLAPPGANRFFKWFSFVTGVVVFGLSLPLYTGFRSGIAGPQFVEQAPWISLFGQQAIWYRVGVDGISLFLVLLTTFLTPVAILSSWNAITTRQREFYASLLILETGMIGVFAALDMFLFYIFWEAMLIPMYFLIGMWGGPNRVYATIKFILFTMFGSLLMLVAIIALFFVHHRATGVYTFDLFSLYGTPLTGRAEFLMFGAFALAFAIKVPLWPLHTWLPDAHVEAPTAGSVILAGVLLKMGTYGFLRFCLPLFPSASAALVPVIAALAIIGIIYGALVAYAQQDIKRLVAYSSVAHLGFVTLGIFTFSIEGIEGGIVQMVSHGLSTGALFLIVGMIYERRHTRDMSQFGGIWKAMPVFGAFFLIVTLASIGLPGLSGFVGEFLVIVGAYKVSAVYAALAASGVVLAAVYMLWLYQRMMQGPVENPENADLPDLSFREIVVLLPVVALIFLIGVFPRATMLRQMDASVRQTIELVEGRNGLPSRVAESPELPVGRLGCRGTGAWDMDVRGARPRTWMSGAIGFGAVGSQAIGMQPHPNPPLKGEGASPNPPVKVDGDRLLLDFTSASHDAVGNVR
ncbi:MAG: NADH-quinone oxidoreductase subunit M [Armatimonadota bacterium]|nr:NADH-quinone oxidoreductase subunit M [Armatimonadota bacterium]